MSLWKSSSGRVLETCWHIWHMKVWCLQMWSSRSFFLTGEEIYTLVTTEGCWCSFDFFSFESLVSLLVPSFLGFPHLLSPLISFCDRLPMFHYLVSCQLIFWRESIVTHTTFKVMFSISMLQQQFRCLKVSHAPITCVFSSVMELAPMDG